MTNDSLPLAELLTKAGDGDFLRSVAEAVVQLLMETGLIGAVSFRSWSAMSAASFMGLFSRWTVA